jgi:hypothetical protein
LQLKGLKGAGLNISIEALYNQLSGGSSPVVESKSVSYHHKENGKYVQPDRKVAQTVLNDLRSQNAISGMDKATVVKFDMLINTLLEEYKR